MMLQSFRRCTSLRHIPAVVNHFSTSKYVNSLLENELKLDYLDGKQEGILVMSINRPAAKNSLSINLMRLFEDAMELITRDHKLRAVILRSIVPGVFCAGADLKERRTMKESDVPLFVGKARMLFHQLSEVPVPTICAIEGAALGGGLEMSLACDFRIASATAKLGLPETKLAIIPGAGGTVRLPRLLGPSKAKELIYTGRVLTSSEAENIGLVNYSVEQNETGDAAYLRSLKLAEEILPQGPIALKVAKQSINKGIEVDIYSALAIEELCYSKVIPTKDRIEGLTAFKEKRKPVYQGE